MALALAVGALAPACGDPGLRRQEGFIAVEGGRVWYRVVGPGEGTPLLVLHGGPGFPSHYLARLRGLSDERRVVFYDQLGAGRSERPDDPTLWRVERFVDELARVRDQLRLDEIHLFGHSWGSMLAVEYMLTRPSGVKSLVLASPALSVPRWLDDVTELRAALPAETREVLDRHEAAGTTGGPEYQAAVMEFYKRHLCRVDPFPGELQLTMEQANLDLYETMWGPSEFYPTGSLKDYDRTDRLGELDLPVLLTAGRHDEATPAAARFYQGLIPGAELEVFEESAHMAMLEETERYLEVIRGFLRRVEGGE